MYFVLIWEVVFSGQVACRVLNKQYPPGGDHIRAFFLKKKTEFLITKNTHKT